MTTLCGPFNCVLVPYDGSEPARAALAQAMLLLQPGVRLIVVTVPDDSPVPAILAEAKKYACDLIVMGTHARPGVTQLLLLGSTTKGVLRWSDIPVLTIRTADAVQLRPFATAPVHVEGSPAEGLLAAAHRSHVTVIIVGSHGRRGLHGFFLGNVAESIVRRSDVPVLVVRERVAEAV